MCRKKNIRMNLRWKNLTESRRNMYCSSVNNYCLALCMRRENTRKVGKIKILKMKKIVHSVNTLSVKTTRTCVCAWVLYNLLNNFSFACVYVSEWWFCRNHSLRLFSLPPPPPTAAVAYPTCALPRYRVTEGLLGHVMIRG
jgi:hypothetical protein